MTARTGGSRASTKQVEGALLAQLGLDRSANPLAIETARDGIVTFLKSAPSEIRPWAQRQIERTDEAYALLSDPTADLSNSADAVDVAFAVAPTPASRAAASDAASAAPRGGGLAARLGPVGKAVFAGLAVVALVGIGYGVYAIGQPAVPGISGSPTPSDAAGGADQAEVADLMQKIAANPNDTESLQALGGIYYDAGDWSTATIFAEKVIAIAPNSVEAHLLAGAAAFGLGDLERAERELKKVIELDPKNFEAYYDLGWVYVSTTPPDSAAAKAAWDKAIEYAPTPEMADQIRSAVENHGGLDDSGGTSAGASAAPASPSASSGN